MLETNNNESNYYENFYNDFKTDSNNDDSQSNSTKKHFLCKFPPLSIPTFKINNNILKVSCYCNRNEEFTYKLALKNLVDDIEEYRNLNDYYRCSSIKHKNKKFKYFCKKCNRHLCKLCLQNTSYHKGHDLVILKDQYLVTKELAQKINDKINKINNIDKDLKELFNIIYDNFSNYPINYSYIMIFKEFEKYIDEHF